MTGTTTNISNSMSPNPSRDFPVVVYKDDFVEFTNHLDNEVVKDEVFSRLVV